MRILIDDMNEFYGERVRLVRTLMKREAGNEYPELLKWKLQMLYSDGEKWIEICRIDNYPHENRQGSHIHSYGKKDVRWMPLSFEEAEEQIREISKRILQEKFGHIIEYYRI